MVKHPTGSLRNTYRTTLPRVFTVCLSWQKPQCGQEGQMGCFVHLQEEKAVLLVLEDGTLHEITKAG